MQCGVAVEHAAFSTCLVNVGVDVSRGISLYQFTNVGNISCSIGYRNDPGCVQESDTDMISVPNGTVLNLTLPRNLLECGLHCYTITAGNGGQTVEVVGEFKTGAYYNLYIPLP